jgi:hypothetical protein
MEVFVQAGKKVFLHVIEKKKDKFEPKYVLLIRNRSHTVI